MNQLCGCYLADLEACLEPAAESCHGSVAKVLALHPHIPVLNEIRVDPQFLGSKLLGAWKVLLEQHPGAHERSPRDARLKKADGCPLRLHRPCRRVWVERVSWSLAKVLPLMGAAQVSC